jgi:hypothetical protein
LIERLPAVLRLSANGQGICIQELANGIARDIVIVNQ